MQFSLGQKLVTAICGNRERMGAYKAQKICPLHGAKSFLMRFKILRKIWSENLKWRGLSEDESTDRRRLLERILKKQVGKVLT